MSDATGAAAGSGSAGDPGEPGDARRGDELRGEELRGEELRGEELREELVTLRSRNEELERALAHKRAFFSVARGSTGRRVIATTLVVLALILAPISVIAVWTANTVTDTSQYVDTVAPLATDPAIQAAVSTRITNRIYDQLDIPALINETLPPKASALEGPLSSAIRGFINTVVTRVVTSSAFEKIWVEANRAVHSQVVGALEGTSSGGVQVKNGAVQLDLGTLVDTVKQRLSSAGLTAAGSIPTSRIDATIVLFRSPQVGKFQRVFQILQTLGDWLPVIVIALLVAGVWLSRDRRRAILGVGVFVGIGMALLLIGLAIVRAYYLAHLPSSVQSPDAAAAAYDILVHFLEQSAAAMLALGIVVAIGAYVAGPSPSAGGLRRASTVGMGRLGDQMELRGALPGGLRSFFAASRTAWDIGLVVAATVSLVLWRARTVLGVILTALLLLLCLLVVEGLGRRGVAPSTAGGSKAPPAGPPVGGVAEAAGEEPQAPERRAVS